MTTEECSNKCKYVIQVLEKVAKGGAVSLAERVDACTKAIEVLCHQDSNNAPQKA